MITIRFTGFMILMLLLGVGIGYLATALGFFPTTIFRVIPDEVKTYAKKVTVSVVETQELFSMSLDDPLCQVLYWQSGGQMMSISRPEVYWQIDLGQEDFPTSDNKGDSLDIILKIAKLKNTHEVLFTVVCTGSFAKKIYYDSELKLDYVEGQKASAFWTIPYS